MPKRFFLFPFLFFIVGFFSPQQGFTQTNAGASTIPIVKCGQLNGTCKQYEARSTSDACDNGEGLFDFGEGTEDYIGYCEGHTGGLVTNRQDCCVPKGSVTPEQVEGAKVGTWTTEALCEAPLNEGGKGGQCRTYNRNVNSVDGILGSDSCAGYSDTPEYVGICGSAGGNEVCCVSKETAAEINSNTGSGSSGEVVGIDYGDYELLEQIPGSNNTSGKLQPYFEGLFRAGFVLIILGAIFMIAVGGFTYMASAGNTYMIKKGKGMITDAIIGLIVALFIWLILNIINPDLVRLQINPLPGLTFDPNSTGAQVAGQNNGGSGGGKNCPAAEPSTTVVFPLAVTDGKGLERATPQTVQNFLAMREAALKAGFDIKVTDGFRPESEQVYLWNQRARIGQVAKPCTLGGNGSNHNSGVALDLQIPGCKKTGDCSSSGAYQWLKANGGKYNFYNNLPGTDNIHWSPSGR